MNLKRLTEEDSKRSCTVAVWDNWRNVTQWRKHNFFQYFPYLISEGGGLFPNDFYDMGDVPTMVIFNVVGCNDQILLTKYFWTSSIIGCTNSILLFLKVHDNHWNLQIPKIILPWFGLLFLTFGIDWSICSSSCRVWIEKTSSETCLV